MGVTTSAEPADLLTLFDPAVRADPYPLYARLREASPITVAGGLVGVFGRFADCETVLEHPAARSDRRRSTLFAQQPPRWAQETPSFLFLDPPDHTRLREWSAVLTRALDPSFALSGRAAEGLDARMAVVEEFSAYFRALTERLRRHPGDDLLSALTAVQDGGDRLTTEELLSTCVLLVAGHETTVNLIANGVLALLRHPAQRAMLAADPAPAPAAVEEVLRYDPPVQLTARIAGEDMTIGGLPLAEGSLALLLLAAAGRDPAVTAEPERFDITREQPRHLAFGHGIHFCLGAPLARSEAQIALAAFARRFPSAALATGDLRYRDNVTLRGLAELPVLLAG